MKKSLLWKVVLIMMICCFSILFPMDLRASVTETNPGSTQKGSYAVIINTNLSASQNTGTLIFDDSVDSDVQALSSSKISTSKKSKEFSESAVTSSSDVKTQESFATTTYQTGQEKYIYQSNGVGKTYVCIGIGSHCYIWMEKNLKQSYDSEGKTSLIASDMAQVYDGSPYQILNTLCGGNFPYEDNSGKLSILLETLSDASGMYMYDEGITAIHINTPAAASYVSGEMSKRNGLLVHEGQHALLWLTNHFPSNETYMWLNEGLSVAVMDYLWGGIDTNGWLSGIAADTGIRNGASLLYKTYRNNTAQDYGMPYLFVRYVIDRMAGSYDPMRVLPEFYHVDASNLSCDQYINNVTGISMKELLCDFYTAIASGEVSGPYSFCNDRVAASKAAAFPIYTGESGKKHSLPPASGIIIKLKDGKFEAPSDGDPDVVYRVISEKNTSTAPSTGDGSATNPYQITSIEDLNLIIDHPEANYQLANDIKVNDQFNFTISYFSGTLDGNGHKITGLKKPLITKNDGKIQNLSISANFDTDSQNVQGVFTQYNNGKIIDCNASGSVKGYMGGEGTSVLPSFGGIAGQNEIAGNISGCSSSLTISLKIAPMKSYIGGICAINYGTIEKCLSNGDISITQSYKDCPVYLGGITGIADIFGYGYMGGILKESLHTGALSVSDENGVIGQLCGIVSNQVVNKGIDTHITTSYGKASSPALIGSSLEIPSSCRLLNADELKDPSSYQGWSFDGDWKMSVDGYPVRADASDITDISLSDTPSSCYIGEIPSSFGKLWINHHTPITITQDMITGFDHTSIGEKHCIVNYKGKSAAFDLHVTEPETSSITNLVVSGHLKKTTYTEGDIFDSSGLSFFGTINGRYVYIYGGYTYKKTALTLQDTSVTINYFGKTVSIPITVTAKKAVSLKILTPPSKTSYTKGDLLDLSGLRLQIIYNNGEKSPVITPKDFEKYQIHIALGKGDSVTTIDLTKKLETKDDKTSLLFYVNDILPGQYGTVTATSETITVTAPLSISSLHLHVSENYKEIQYINTDNVTGGSGQYKTTVIRENLPTGLIRDTIPDNDMNYFSYHGIVTAPKGSYFGEYEIKDLQTEETLKVYITIYVHAANKAYFYQFDLQKNLNPQLANDIKGEILEDMIILRVPTGTDVTKLKPSIDYGSSSGTTLKQEFWNGTAHDFTNPVEYVLTAPDGITTKTYMVKIEFFDPDGKNDETENTENTESTKKDKDTTTQDQKTTTSSAVTTAIKPKSDITVKPGTRIYYKNGIYEILTTNTKKRMVRFIKPSIKTPKTYRVYDTIRYQSKTYNVTQIASRAFYNQKRLTSLRISKHTQMIGKQAFYGCKKIKRFKLPAKISNIDRKAFGKWKKKVKIYVPKKQYKKYKKLFKKAGLSSNCKIKKY